jgi:hypothetical protein
MSHLLTTGSRIAHDQIGKQKNVDDCLGGTFFIKFIFGRWNDVTQQ